MKIALDVDGVLADVIISWLLYNNKFRKPLSKKDVTDWDFWKALHIDRFSFYDELSVCWKDWHSIPPTEQNLHEITEKLSGIAQVDIVTARQEWTDPYVKDWLDFHDISYDQYVSVAAGSMKADLDYDAFIDDSPLNASRFLRNDKSILLYSQPWNMSMSHPRMNRISSLSEAVGILSP